MCKAFSCIVTEDCHDKWQFGVDSHEEIIGKFGLKDDGHSFARVEIVPLNSSYLTPDEWGFRLDEKAKPKWWTPAHEAEAWGAQKDWKKKLDKILAYKPIVHPFKDAKPPKKITKGHLDLLKQWDSVWAIVRDSVGASVRASVGDSVGASVWASVGDSVGASVWASVWDIVRASVGASVRDSVGASVWASVGDNVWDSAGASVWDSVGAYSGSFFTLPREAWEYTENIKLKRGQSYPFQPAVDLWELGLVPSFDGKVWRLHGGPNGEVLWEGEL